MDNNKFYHNPLLCNNTMNHHDYSYKNCIFNIVEAPSYTFSVFGYTLTNTKYVAPSTGGPGSSSLVLTITRKPVVNTSAK